MTKKFKRKEPGVRKEDILAEGVRLAEEIGFMQITRDKLAGRVGCSSPLIRHYFKSMVHFKKEVMKAAIEVESLEVLMQGLVLHQEDALSADPALRRKAYENLAQKAFSTSGKPSNQLSK